MSFLNDLQGDEEVIFDEFAKDCTYTIDPSGQSVVIATKVLQSNFGSLVEGPGGQKEAAVFTLPRSVFNGSIPKYQDTIAIVGEETWKVVRVVNADDLSFTVEVRRAERGKY